MRQRRLRGLGRLPIFRLRGGKRCAQFGALPLLLCQRCQLRAALRGRFLRVPGLRGGHGQLRLIAQFPARGLQRLCGRVRPGACRVEILLLLRQPFAFRLRLCAQRVELFIPPQRIFQPRDALPPALNLRLRGLGGVQRRLCGLGFRLRLRPRGLRFGEFHTRGLQCLCLAEVGEHLLAPRLRIRAFCLCLRQRGFVRVQQRIQRFQQRAGVQRVRQRLRVGAADAPGRLAQPGLQLAALPVERSRLFLEPVLQRLIPLRVENLAEDGLALVRLGEQQLSKLPLRDHRDARKLLPVHADDVRHGGGHVARLGDDAAVRHRQLGVRLLHGRTRSARFRARVFGVAAHGVGPAAVCEGQLHERRRLGRGVFAAQHGALAALAARLAVERVGDRVKDSRLAGARVTGDEVEPGRAERRKVYGRLPGVRAEGGHGQVQRSHGCTSRISSMSCAANARCSSLMGWLFCCK